MVKLFCLVINEQNAFEVNIDADNSISNLAAAIYSKREATFKRFGADDFGSLNIHKAVIHTDKKKKLINNNNYLQNDEEHDIPCDLNDYMINSMVKGNMRISSYFPNNIPDEGVVHVLVEVVKEESSQESSNSQSSHYKEKKRRWDELNIVLDGSDKSKVTRTSNGAMTIPYSSVPWSLIESIYQKYIKSVPTMVSKRIDDENVINHLYDILVTYTRAFKGISGPEAQRLYFIAPFLACVSNLFNGDITMLVEEVVNGKEETLHANGKFEFVLQRGNKRVCIVEAKKEDIDQGKAQNLLGCEVLLEKVDYVYGIVTNYVQWIFFTVKPGIEYGSILEYSETLKLKGLDMPEKSDVRNIAEKIYGLLSNDE